jgi:hypothetical protein
MKDKQFLQAVIDEIEEAQEQIDSEWGSCRTAAKLAEQKLMPKVYYEAVKRLKALNEDSSSTNS